MSSFETNQFILPEKSTGHESESQLTSFPTTHRQKMLNEFDQQSKSEALISKNGQSDLAEYIINAKVLIENNELELAENLVNQILLLDPSAKCCFIIADAYYEKGVDQEALPLYLIALELIENDEVFLFDLYKNLGNIYLRLQDLDAAEENYNRAYTLNPDSDTLLVNFGTLEIQKGNLEKSCSHFRQAIQINSNNDKAWVGLALIHREYSDYELSWANVERALDINPLNETALQLEVDWGVQDGRINLVIERVEYFVSQNLHDSVSKLTLAQLHFYVGRYKTCEKILQDISGLGINGVDQLLESTRERLKEQWEVVNARKD